MDLFLYYTYHNISKHFNMLFVREFIPVSNKIKQKIMFHTIMFDTLCIRGQQLVF